MTTFVNNDVASGAVVYAADHNEQGSRVAAVLNGGIDNANIKAGAAIDGSKLADGSITPNKIDLDPVVSSVATPQPTLSSAFTGLDTAQVIVATVGSNGVLLVNIGATMSSNGANASYASFALSGANTLAASDAKSIINVGTNAASFGRTFLVNGLTPGPTTITMQFRASSGTSTFSNREISAIPL